MAQWNWEEGPGNWRPFLVFRQLLQEQIWVEKAVSTVVVFIPRRCPCANERTAMVASIMRVIVFLSALCLFGAGFWLCWKKRGGIIPTYAAAVFCLIFTFLPEFQFFKGLGVEAKLRDTLREADTTIAQLRGLLAPLSEFMFTVTAQSGRFGVGMRARDRYRLATELESELVKLGLSRNQIEIAKKDWHCMNLQDLSLLLINPLMKMIEEKQQEQHKIIGKIQSRGPISPTDATHKAATERLWHIAAEENRLEECLVYKELDHIHENLRRFLETTDVFSSDEKRAFMDTHKDELADLAYYAEHKEFRRLEHWLQLCDATEKEGAGGK